MPYERFTDRARKVMLLATQEAQRFNHEYVGTEHILLGLIAEGNGVAANVLKNLGIDLRKIRHEVEKLVHPGSETITVARLPQTPRSKKVLDYAMEESRIHNHNYVGTEHLLLGLLREEEGIASQVLMNLGLQIKTVHNEILRLIGYRISETDNAHPDDLNVVYRRTTIDQNSRVSKYFHYFYSEERGEVPLEEFRKMSPKLFADDFQSFCEAAKKGDIEKLTALFDAGICSILIDARDIQGKTPFFYAVRSNRVETVKFLIEKGANINVQDSGGMTPLHVAVNGNSSNIIGILIKAGAKLELKNNASNTPLALAEKLGGRPKVERLLKKAILDAARKTRAQIDINASSTKQLHFAVESGDIETVKDWIGRGADVNTKARLGGTPLHIAADKGYPEIVAVLIEAGADVNAKDDDGETPLHRAVLKDSKSMSLLIKAGANVDARENESDSPLHYAAQVNAIANIAALIDAGATIDFVGDYGWTPIFNAIRWKNLEAVKLLLERGANVNFRIDLADSTSNGESPIHTAALYATIEIMAALLDAGADIEAQSAYGKKAIDLAIRAKKMEMVQFLSARWAKAPNLLDHSRPDDMWAKAERWYKAVKTADEIPDDDIIDHMESLCRAIRQGNVEVVTLLLHKRRTNVNAFDKRGYMPLH